MKQYLTLFFVLAILAEASLAHDGYLNDTKRYITEVNDYLSKNVTQFSIKFPNKGTNKLKDNITKLASDLKEIPSIINLNDFNEKLQEYFDEAATTLNSKYLKKMTRRSAKRVEERSEDISDTKNETDEGSSDAEIMLVLRGLAKVFKNIKFQISMNTTDVNSFNVPIPNNNVSNGALGHEVHRDTISTISTVSTIAEDIKALYRKKVGTITFRDWMKLVEGDDIQENIMHQTFKILFYESDVTEGELNQVIAIMENNADNLMGDNTTSPIILGDFSISLICSLQDGLKIPTASAPPSIYNMKSDSDIDGNSSVISMASQEEVTFEHLKKTYAIFTRSLRKARKKTLKILKEVRQRNNRLLNGQLVDDEDSTDSSNFTISTLISHISARSLTRSEVQIQEELTEEQRFDALNEFKIDNIPLRVWLNLESEDEIIKAIKDIRGITVTSENEEVVKKIAADFIIMTGLLVDVYKVLEENKDSSRIGYSKYVCTKNDKYYLRVITKDINGRIEKLKKKQANVK